MPFQVAAGAVRPRPCLLLAHPDATFRADAGRRLRRLGWDVYPARTGPESRRLARMLQPDLILLDVDLEEESGWLTCAKVTGERIGSLVVLLADGDDRSRERARFVGATGVASRQGGLEALLEAAIQPAVLVNEAA